MANPSIEATKQKTGTRYAVDQNGAADIKERYQVVLASPLLAGQLITSFPGVPAIGSEHPQRPDYYVDHYDVTQPDGAAKATLDVDVTYAATGFNVEPGEEPVDTQVEEWGWDDGTADRELLTDVTGKPVVNSAGDPFENVPTVTAPAPTFTKVVKFKTRQSVRQYFCKVNGQQMTIGGDSFAPGQLLCTVSERRNIGDKKWAYVYTVRLRFRSNLVKIAQAQQATDIGWDIAVTDAGMREIDDTTGGLKLIQVPSGESGEFATVTSAELLDGHGKAIARSASGAPVNPYNIKFAAYETANFPAWFTSEPPV
jgi:hypothetical protein